MRFLWNRAIAGVVAQPDPPFTAGTEDSMGLELGNIWISSEEVDTFLLRSLRPTLLSLGMRCWHASGGEGRKGQRFG